MSFTDKAFSDVTKASAPHLSIKAGVAVVTEVFKVARKDPSKSAMFKFEGRFVDKAGRGQKFYYLDYNEKAVADARKKFKQGSKWTLSEMALDDALDKFESGKYLLDLKKTRAAPLTDADVPTYIPQPLTGILGLLDAKKSRN